jgi:hypothetical protein
VSQRPSTPAGPRGAGGPASPEPDDWDDDDEWPDDLWPDDDEPAEVTAGGAGASAGSRGDGGAGAGRSSRGDGPAWPAPSWPSMPPPPPLARRLPVAALVAIALTAAGIGALIVLAARGLSGSPATPSSQPTAQAPAQPGGSGGGAFPGNAAGGMFVGGRVTAVSATSITLGGPGRSITAAVTSSTRFTGQVSSISGVKVGDLVTAQLTQNGGSVTVIAISDPAQLPAGGGPP